MELKKNNENKKSSELEKNKELLIKLLKQKLENRIYNLERRNQMHLNLMNVTIHTIKEITKWSINANNQIKEKTKRNEKPLNQVLQKTIIKNKKYEKIEVRSNTRKQSFRSKTPLRTKTTKPLIPDETKALTVNRNYIKSNKYFTINTKSEKLLDTKQKSNSFYIKKKKRKSINNNLNIETDALRRPSEISNKSNKTSTSKKKKNIETPLRKKTPFKKKNMIEKIEKNNLSVKLNENKSSEIVINSKIIKKVKKKKDDITQMETALQKGEFLTNNDPLLISPITDLDFFIDKKMSNSNISISLDLKEKEKEKLNLLINNIDDKIYKNISDFLDIEDLIKFKDTSKFFHKLFIVYIENLLENDKIYFSKKLKNLNIIDSIPQKQSINSFNISKKCMKAIELLNEPSVNQFFFQKTLVDDERLIIYRIFFQLIKHPYKNIEKYKKEEFWEKCRYFFSHETNGKVGELLQKIYDEKMININGNNLYKIYKLAYKDLDKIYPKYFSNFCGTTGLITFFIKDVLDFVGISNNENIQINAYWTYNDIIEDLNSKIDYLKNSKIN